MKDIIKYIGLLGLIVFSFYYTDKISTMIIYESDLMKEIISNKEKENIPSVNAEIVGSYITPGLNGLEINELDSYYQMKKDYVYSSNKLIFNEIEPNTTIEKNKHLIINKGNIKKNGVALILSNNEEIIKYCENESIKIDVLTTYKSFDKNKNFEQINNEINFDKLEVLLDKYKLNTNICVVNDDVKEVCEKEKKYLVKPTYEINNVKIVGAKINSGDIIYISDNLSLVNFKILLKKINYQDLKILLLSELISEKRNEK